MQGAGFSRATIIGQRAKVRIRADDVAIDAIGKSTGIGGSDVIFDQVVIANYRTLFNRAIVANTKAVGKDTIV